MLIKIEYEAIGRVRVLPELPDARLAIVEGLNGIGKTLAVRLVQLCASGRPPFRSDEQAWRSLCRNLGPFTVTITNLHGANRLQWVANPADWIDVPLTTNALLTFREITIDGKESSHEAVAQLFSVARLGGEEGILETFALQADERADAMERWRRQFADETKSPLATLEARTQECISLLGDWTGQRYRDLTSAIESAEKTLVATVARLDEVTTRRADLLEIEALGRETLAAEESMPELRGRISELDLQMAGLQERADDIQRQIREISAQLGVAQTFTRELANAERTLTRNQTRLENQLRQANLQATRLEILPDYSACTQLSVHLQSRRDELQAERIRLDAAPEVRRVLVSVLPHLNYAEQRGLGEEIVIDASQPGGPLTVREARLGMESRRVYLTGKPPEPEVRELDRQLAEIDRRIADTIRLRETLDAVQRFRRLVGENEERVEAALIRMNPEAVDRLKALDARRRELDGQLVDLRAQRAADGERLQLLEARTAGTIKRDVEARLVDLGVTPESLTAEILRIDQEVQNSLVERKQLEESLDQKRRDLQPAEMETRQSATALKGSPSAEWLRKRLPGSFVQATDSIDARLTLLDSARAVLSQLYERLSTFRNHQLGAIRIALQDIGQHLRGRGDIRPLLNVDQAYLDELVEWIGGRFNDWFNTPVVRQELLPRAEGPIEVDVLDREVRWTEVGKPYSRPLVSFSSGEQAFTYTRARLGILEQQDSATNRLIVLDEFGAFIAHDWLSELKNYLIQEAQKHPSDQILIILPLAQNYEEAARNSLGSEAQRLASLAQQVRERQFATTVLVP